MRWIARTKRDLINNCKIAIFAQNKQTQGQ